MQSISCRFILGLLILVLLTQNLALSQSQSADYEYYYYYYEDEAPKAATSPPKTSARPVQQEQSPDVGDYDISELVRAWRDYIKEKKQSDKVASTSASTGSRRPSQSTGSRRPAPAPRPRPQLFEEEYEEYECEPRDESYRIPDPIQCDKYYECNIKGELKEKLCPDGLVFEEKSQNCDFPSKVVCGERTELQAPQESKNCPRANGFFAWPAEESCQKFWYCREGTAYLQDCPTGVIFDMKVDACVTPDQSAREECSAKKFLEFDCPTYTNEDVLRFGNHDRLPDPNDCVKFYSCLKTGQPRLGVCPRKTVFNNATGQCDDPKAVPGCESYWKDKEEEELLDYYDY